jgi:putative flippase GtrA
LSGLGWVRAVVKSRRGRYLLVGGFNTVVGYLIGVSLLYGLSPAVHVLVIGAVANVLAITVAFTTYKLFVFRTRGRWINEYLRSYLVYGGMAVVGTLLLWILVDGLRLPMWLAQGLAVVLTVVVSYLGHSRYTFSAARQPEQGRSE